MQNKTKKKDILVVTGFSPKQKTMETQLNHLKNIIVLILVLLNFNSRAQDFVWAKNMGGTNIDQGQSIVVDALGNVYITGNFYGTADFDPGVGIFNLISEGKYDIFVCKLDASGNLVWAKSIGGTDNDIGYSIAVDALGNVYTTGYFSGIVDFDPGVGTFNLTSDGNGSAFVSKLDASGNLVWARNMGGSSGLGNSINVDASGNVYTTGKFQGTADFDPGVDTFNISSAGMDDIFVSKLDAYGNLVWAKSIGGASNDIGYSIAVDALGNVYTTGYFSGTADFDPGEGTSNLISAGSFDIFVSKLDASGNLVWAKSIGGTMADYGYAIIVDASENVYTTGYFMNSADFDPGTGIYYLTSSGVSDIFVSKLDAMGSLVWAKNMGGTDNDIGYSIALDVSGNVYTTGYFQGTADFDPGTGTFYLSSSVGGDIFVSKLNALGDLVWAINMAGTDFDHAYSIAIDGSANIYTTGDFYGTSDFDPGPETFNLTSVGSCDIYINKMSQCIATSSSFSLTTCDNYTVPSGDKTYSVSGTYMDTIPNYCGADSVIMINLTINTSNTGTDLQTACNSFIWPLNGTTYTSSTNTPTVILTNTAGCDSVVTLNLTINKVDTSVTVASPMLTANATGATYQWLDCNNGHAPLTDETNQSFTAESNGIYAVEVTQNGCTDTSDCYSITNVGFMENGFGNALKVYPNPTNGNIIIDLGSTYTNITVKVLSANGKHINTKTFFNTKKINFNINGAKGFYFAEVMAAESKKAIIKILKK